MTVFTSDPPQYSAQQTEARAAEWLDRRFLWDWDDEKQAQLNRWLAEDTAHLVTYLRLEAAWARIERLSALRRPLPEQRLSLQRGRGWLPFAKLTAGIVVLVAVGVTAIGLEQASQGKSFSTPVGGRETLAFLDGSQIELNTNTVLHTEIAQDRRVAILEQGEAYFQIKHDQNHPFIVTAGNSRLIDLGTKFLARREGDRLQVTLIDGRVHLETSTDAGMRQITMSPGETAYATRGGLIVKRRQQKELANALSWRKGVLVFQHTTLAAAVAEFNRYNERKISIADATAGRLTINGTFPANDVEPFVEVTEAVFGLRTKKGDDEIVLMR